MIHDLNLQGSTICLTERGPDNHYISKVHTHNYYEFFILLENDIRHNVNGTWHRVSHNSLQLLRPNDAHYYRPTQPEQGLGLMNIAFPVSHMMRALEYLGIPEESLNAKEFLVLHPIPPDLLQMIFMKARQIKNIQTSPDDRTSIFLSLLADILPILVTVDSSTPTPPRWLQDAIELMHLPENLYAGLPRLIELAGKSQNHINKVIKKQFHIPTSQLINNLRFEQVNEQLITSDKKIIDILLDAGFNNVPYFNASYKKRFGMTPRQYRNRMTHCL